MHPLSRFLVIWLLLVCVFHLFLSVHNTHDHVCSSFLEHSFLPAKGSGADSAMTEETFNSALGKVQAVYSPIFARLGLNLVIEKRWSSDLVNAFAMQSKNTAVIEMHGGLARFPEMTGDALILVACHEIGHHIGGAPKISSRSHISSEGQSDYYATLKCVRPIFALDTDLSWLVPGDHDLSVILACKSRFSDNQKAAICVRSIEAAQHLKAIIEEAKVYSPDIIKGILEGTFPKNSYEWHPEAQCRLDTYVAGALCAKEFDDEVSNSDPRKGSCNIDVSIVGARPLCWYGVNPSTQDALQPVIEQAKKSLEDEAQRFLEDLLNKL